MSAANGGGEAFAEELARRLDARPSSDGAEVVGWRFDLSESRSIRAGLKDSRLGGPYDPPSLADGTGGGIYLIWSDAQQTYANVDVLALEEFGERVADWRLNAFADPYAPPILPPAQFPSVQTYDPNVVEILEGRTAEFFDLLRQALEAGRASGAQVVDAGVGAGEGTRFLYYSSGLRLSYPETSFSFWLSADDLYSRGFGKRRVIEADEVAELLEDVCETTAALRSDGSLESGVLPIVLPPGESGSFLGHYLGSNLSGAAVVNGHSAYTLDDFRQSKQVVRADLRLRVDTLLALEGAATPATSEGVPGGQVDLVRDGRLLTPLLDLKYAARASMPPTPLPRGGPGMLVETERLLDRPDALLAGVERGLYVYSVLGMHTQDSSSGRYSLVASQARPIRNGRLLDGKVKAVLAGDFFEHLRDDGTLFARFPHEWTPGMRVLSNVSVES